MPSQNVDGLIFDFRDGWAISKYDDWSFYRNRFSRFLQAKAVDLLAISPNRTVFLIEVKDYRRFQRTKAISLADEITTKVVDTLAAMLPAKVNGDDGSEIDFSDRVLRAQQLRVVLHLEQPVTPSRLFPRAIDPADIQQKMRQKLKPLDAHPLVVERNNMMGLLWNVH